MNIEKQVVSLELAKRLKGLGVKQESLCGYANYRPFASSPELKHQLRVMKEAEEWEGETYAAFTVAELGEILPSHSGSYCLTIEKHSSGGWIVSYYDSAKRSEFKSVLEVTDADTEAEARGLMLAYLIENKLASV